ncbi:MFS transporter [Sphingomonas sp. GB1N7]
MAEIDGSGEWRRGWPIVAGAAAMFATGPALYQNLSSLFVPGLQQTLGLTRGQIATAAGFGLLGALAAPVVGRIADRIGVMPVIIASALLLAFAHVFLSTMTGPAWHFQLGVAMLAVSAPGVSALVFGRLIARSFDVHRGLALGVATAGISLSSLIMPSIVAAVIADYGWRSAYLLLAAIAIGFGLPLTLLAIRVTRSKRLPDRTSRVAPQRDASLDRATWRGGLFWRLAGAIALINMGTVGMVTQLAPLGQDRGFSVVGAGLLVTAYAAAQIVGRLGMGVLIDRFPAERMAAAVGLVSAVGFVVLCFDVPFLPVAMMAVFFAGLMNGAEHDLLPYFVSRFFALDRFGEVYGKLFMLSLIGSAIGIIGFGRLYDVTGTYLAPLACAGIAMVAAAQLLLSMPPSGPSGRGVKIHG